MKTSKFKSIGLLALFTLLLLVEVGGGQVQQFGIFSPAMGMREDIPSILIPQAYTTENENVIMRDGEIHRAKLRSAQFIGGGGAKTKTPDNNPILKFHYFEKADNTDYLLAFTKDHAYQWNTGTKVWDLKFTCAASCSRWSAATYNEKLFITNGMDLIQVWDGTGSFAALGDASLGIPVDDTNYLSKAAFLVSFSGYLMAGNVTITAGAYPTGIFWCDTNDAITVDTGVLVAWKTGNAGSTILPGPDPLVGAGKIDDFLFVFSGRSIDQLWNVDSTMVFNARRLRTGLGSYSPESIVNGVNGELYFLDGQKNIRSIPSSMSDFDVISVGMDKTLKLIPTDLVNEVQSIYISEYEQKWFAIPYGTDATGNNQVLCLDKYGSWTKLDMAVNAFGEFENKVQWTIDTIPFATIDAIGWDTIDSVEALADYRLDICSDYAGYGYNSHDSDMDDGTAYTGYAVLGTDFSSQKGSPGLDVYKRLTGMTLYFRNENGGTAELSIKRDTESAWQTVGSVDLSGDGDILWKQINCDYRARFYQLKISGANPFRFVGVVFYYVPQGLR